MLKRNKKLVILLILVVLLSGCSNTDKETETGKLKVITTIFPQYDFLKNIGGDKVDLEMLIPPGSETHSFEPSPKDIIAIENSDMFIYVGGESDIWVDKMLKSIDTSKVKMISLMEVVDLYEEEIVEGMESDHNDEHDEEIEYDEHIWTSPKNAIIIVKTISEELSKIDVENSNEYEIRTNEYLEALTKLDDEFRELTKKIEKPLIVGDRFPFRYFIEEYGLKYYAAFPGCASETEANPRTIRFLIDKVEEEDIGVVYYIEFSNQKMADIIAERTGAKKLLLHSAHNVTKEDFENDIGYMELMKSNLKNLEEALN